jgi:hypothetical protein
MYVQTLYRIENNNECQNWNFYGAVSDTIRVFTPKRCQFVNFSVLWAQSSNGGAPEQT